LRHESIKLLLKVIPEIKLNPVASRSSFAFSVRDNARQRHTCSTCYLALAWFCQCNDCSTSSKLNRYLPTLTTGIAMLRLPCSFTQAEMSVC